MFHHTHSFLASKLYTSDSAELLFGSILPDIAVTGLISWSEGLHGLEQDTKFREFIEKKYPTYLNLANGVHAHNVVDDFTHVDYKGKTGYAFQNNRELSLLVGRFYELDEERSKGKAHNFIESSVDLQLLKDLPEIQTKLRLALNQIDREKIAEILATFFRKGQKKCLNDLNLFIDLFTKYDFSLKEEWVHFWTDLEKLMKLKNIGDGKRTQLLNKSLEVTKKNYNEFLTYAEQRGKEYL